MAVGAVACCCCCCCCICCLFWISGFGPPSLLWKFPSSPGWCGERGFLRTNWVKSHVLSHQFGDLPKVRSSRVPDFVRGQKTFRQFGSFIAFIIETKHLRNAVYAVGLVGESLDHHMGKCEFHLCLVSMVILLAQIWSFDRMLYDCFVKGRQQKLWGIKH